VIISDFVLIQLSSWGWAHSCLKHVQDSIKHIIEEIVCQFGHLPELFKMYILHLVSGLPSILWYSIHNRALHRWDLLPATGESSGAATPLLSLVWITTVCYWRETESMSKILCSVEITRWPTQSRQSITLYLTLSAFQCPSSCK
jgi:hypothetical protein